MRQINTQLSNRAIYTLVSMMFLILIGAGIIIVNAYGGSSPSVVGHSAGEIEGVCKTDGTGCPNFDIPSGAIMAFDLTSCPSGWTEYTSARDRTIIGSGSSYSRGATGGEASHTLTISEMPSHSHDVPYEDACGTSTPSISSWQAGNCPHRTIAVSYTGGNAAHNNMQPYIALLYCKKN